MDMQPAHRQHALESCQVPPGYYRQQQDGYIYPDNKGSYTDGYSRHKKHKVKYTEREGQQEVEDKQRSAFFCANARHWFFWYLPVCIAGRVVHLRLQDYRLVLYRTAITILPCGAHQQYAWKMCRKYFEIVTKLCRNCASIRKNRECFAVDLEDVTPGQACRWELA